MITVDVKENDREEKPEYPCLKIGDDGVIILFNSYKCGCVVAPGEDNCPIGDYSDEWVEEAFIPFSGSVTLRNEL